MMKLGRLTLLFAAVATLAFVILVGCGVDSGVRDDSTPNYTSNPEPGLPGGGTNPGSNPGDASANEQSVFEIVNDEREKAGRNPLQWCDGLAELARAHSNDMCDRGFFSHVNPEGENPTARGRAGHAGSHTFDPIVPSPYRGIGENIAMGQRSPEEVMNAWMNSSGHRANILNGGYTHIGVGICSGCGRHWTQTFGTR